MRAVVQRICEAQVVVAEMVVGAVGTGLLVYLGVEQLDSRHDADQLAEKILGLRVFEDEAGRMNLSLKQVSGSMLVVSQFTLLGDCRKGKRPSFDRAASPECARLLYEYFVEFFRQRQVPTQTGVFGEMMRVHSVNDGPVTILLDSRKLF